MAKVCPTCGSAEPTVCNGDNIGYPRPHPHGRYECCCHDIFHAGHKVDSLPVEERELHLPAVVHGPLPKNLPQFEGIDYPIGGKPTLPVEATPLEIAEEREEFYGGGEQAAGVEAKPASKEEEDGTIRETR